MNKHSSSRINVIAVVGATASGKTAYSIELAKKVNGEIISADSRLVYKGFDIGTAKPTAQEKQDIPHYLIDIVEPTVEYSAGLYKKQAEEKIKEISLRNKTPIIVGGTGLYIDILLKGFELPHIEPDKNLREKLSEHDNEKLFQMLYQKDPQGAIGIEKNDKKKLIRALEIVIITGNKLSQARGKTEETKYNIQWIGRNYPRKELYERIDSRVDLMIENGLLDETRELLNKYGRIYNLINTIGYREIIKYIDGELTLEESKNLLKQNTRKYAKRQLTWFRKNEDIEWNVYPEKLKK